jgi:anti-sigma-K factor RskA
LDIKEYISSGIIEAYVMGLASEEEVRILDCIQKHSPDVRQAILDAQHTLEDFAASEAIAPPPELKESIWAKISATEEQTDIAGTDVVQEPTATPLYPTVTPESNKTPLKWLAVAASILLVASISLNLYFNRSQNNIKEQLAVLSAEHKASRLAFKNLESKWTLATNPAVKIVPLLGVERHPDMKAVVYFEQNSKDVYLALENLPAAPKDQQYQLWAIVDGKPVSLGVFDQDSEVAVQKMTTISSAQAFAITLEKRGGSPVPTMENMYVMGKV